MLRLTGGLLGKHIETKRTDVNVITCTFAPLWICSAGVPYEFIHWSILHRSCLVLCEQTKVEKRLAFAVPLMHILCVKRAYG